MNWGRTWDILSARISGVAEAAEFVAKTLTARNEDSFGVIPKQILPALVKIENEIRKFRDDYSGDLPPVANDALQKFLNSEWLVKERAYPQAILLSTAPLIAFQAEFTHLIQDTQFEIFHRTERAFEHLKRLIAVDSAVRETWNQAFNSGEVKCEELGSVHLLSHGIWAFKVAGGRAITDLVFKDRPFDELLIRTTAASLVMTEWKIVPDPATAPKKALEAKKQMLEYDGGVLGDMELKNTRYIVLVSKNQLQLPSDFEEGGHHYRHIGIAADPLNPSKVARRKGK